MAFIECIFSTTCFIEALHEKKQAIMNYETEIAKLQAQVKNSEEYQTTVKENEGKIIEYYVNYQHIAFLSSVQQYQKWI